MRIIIDKFLLIFEIKRGSVIKDLAVLFLYIYLHHGEYLVQSLFVYGIKLYHRMLVVHFSAVIQGIKLIYIPEKCSVCHIVPVKNDISRAVVTSDMCTVLCRYASGIAVLLVEVVLQIVHILFVNHIVIYRLCRIKALALHYGIVDIRTLYLQPADHIMVLLIQLPVFRQYSGLFLFGHGRLGRYIHVQRTGIVYHIRRKRRFGKL